MDRLLSRSRSVLVVAVTLTSATLPAAETIDPVDRELRQLISANGLTGDPSAGRELPAIDDPRARLGLLLFFSKALSGDLDVACASCHHPLLAGGDGLSLSVGVGAEDPDLVGPGRRHDWQGRGTVDPDADGGPNVPRNAPTTFNVAMYDKFLFHDGRVESVAKLPGRNGAGGGIIDPDSLLRTADPDAGDNLAEAQARFPTSAEDEMLGFRFGKRRPGAELYAHLEARLGNYGIGEDELPKSEWLDHFRLAFDMPEASAEELITFANIIKAMGEYQRSQVFVDTPWKRYVQGDSSALSDAQKRGALLFYRAPDDGGAGCAGCHGGDFFTDEAFHVLAMPQIGRGKSNGPYLDHDNGRFKVSRRSGDKFAFRTLSLLNVAATAPYSHGGAYETLDDVIWHHLDPVAAVAEFDYSLQGLRQFAGTEVRYAHARENTEAALARLIEKRKAGESHLPSTDLGGAEIADLVAFLESLTDPCVLDARCLAPWVPAAGDADPDGAQLRAVFKGETVARGPLFTDVTGYAGFSYSHGVGVDKAPESAEDIFTMQYKIMAGGVAAGDYDRDGWVDLYVVRGAAGPNLLFRNLGTGRFEEVGAEAGVDISGDYNGPTFADYDGDGWLDLFVGGVSGTAALMARNTGDGRFEVVTAKTGLDIDRNTFSSSFGDYDLDGDLDLFTGHWELRVDAPVSQHLWRNDGNGSFTDVSETAGLGSLVSLNGEPPAKADVFTFAGVFADINNDLWPDLLVAGDFMTSRIYVNDAQGAFEDRSDMAVLTDENAMGVAAADYDNDGDIDWFVSSIYHGDEVSFVSTRYRFGSSGNRLYQNQGDGTLVDVTELTGVREGGWAWAACFADFNNDGQLDLFHVNGMGDPNSEWWKEEIRWFLHDSSRLFLADSGGRFVESAAALGIDDAGQGRGVSCFDYDRDGDIDIFVANSGQPPILYRNGSENNAANRTSYLAVKLKGLPPNTEAVGARVYVTAGDRVQMRELQAGTNYLSQNPVEAHFGLGPAATVDEVCIEWPGRPITNTRLRDVPANQFLVVEQMRRNKKAPPANGRCLVDRR